VVSIDTTTVQRIVEAVQTARLLGTEVLLAGITPAVAQMILALGVELRHIRAFADLRAALQAAAFTA
jgi:rsbT co-antagonist protein RsbR